MAKDSRRFGAWLNVDKVERTSLVSVDVDQAVRARSHAPQHGFLERYNTQGVPPPALPGPVAVTAGSNAFGSAKLSRNAEIFDARTTTR